MEVALPRAEDAIVMKAVKRFELPVRDFDSFKEDLFSMSTKL
jgi:hypothetical protein